MAADDAHYFTGEFSANRSNPDLGWIVVRANELNAEKIVRNVEVGLFYSSTGIALEDIIISPRRLEIRIQSQGDRKYRTEFIGRNGKILEHSIENPAVYKLKGNEKYVRAKVYDSGGFTAWVQSIFLRRR